MERTLSSGLLFEQASSTSQAAWPLRLVAALTVWKRRIISRRQLARLDSRLLADAGISESQRYVEMNKPFWR